MDDLQLKQILEKLSGSQNILIAVSKTTGFDGLASGLALYLSLKRTGKSASIISQKPTVGDALTLYGVDKIGGGTEKDFAIYIDNAVKNVDKVTYNLEGNKLKIVVHAVSNSQGVQGKDVSLSKTAISSSTVIAIGYKSREELKNEITHEQIIDSDAWIFGINVDKPNIQFAQVEFNDPSSSSISELTTKILKNLNLPIDEDISFNLYSGIKLATEMFSPRKTNPMTLEIAQHLLKLGAGNASLSKSPAESFNTVAKDKKISKAPPSPDLSSKIFRDKIEAPIEDVEVDKKSRSDWLKPPKVYKGAKSFDTES